MGDQSTTSRYTIAHMFGCVVIEGAIPVAELTALVKVWGGANGSSGWIHDMLLAEALGCSFVFGPQPACHRWRTRLGIEPTATTLE
jgi:hypothetical protein